MYARTMSAVAVSLLLITPLLASCGDAASPRPSTTAPSGDDAGMVSAASFGTPRIAIVHGLDGSDITATALNDKDEIVGVRGAQAFRWLPDGGLRSLSGNGGMALGVNDFGEVVGSVPTADSGTATADWSASGRLTVLSTFLPSNEYNPSFCGAAGINGRRLIVGVCADAAEIRVILWHPDGTLENPSFGTGFGTAVSDRDFTTGGTAGDATPLLEAFRITARSSIDFGTLSGPLGTQAIGLAVNDRGVVAGRGTIPSGESHAMLWHPPGSPSDLAPGITSSVAVGISDGGAVVGTVPDAQVGPTRAFVWTKWRGLRYLPIPKGATSSAAVAINDRDDILGTIVDAQGVRHTVFWLFSGADRDLASAVTFVAAGSDHELVGVVARPGSRPIAAKASGPATAQTLFHQWLQLRLGAGAGVQQ